MQTCPAPARFRSTSRQTTSLGHVERENQLLHEQLTTTNDELEKLRTANRDLA